MTIERVLERHVTVVSTLELSTVRIGPETTELRGVGRTQRLLARAERAEQRERRRGVAAQHREHLTHGVVRHGEGAPDVQRNLEPEDA